MTDQTKAKITRVSMPSWWTRTALNACDYLDLNAQSDWTDNEVDQAHRALSDHADTVGARVSDEDLRADLFRLARSGVNATVAITAVRAGLTATEITDLAARDTLDPDVVAAMAGLRPPAPPSLPYGAVSGMPGPSLSGWGAKMGAGKSFSVVRGVGYQPLVIVDALVTSLPAAFHNPSPTEWATSTTPPLRLPEANANEDCPPATTCPARRAQ